MNASVTPASLPSAAEIEIARESSRNLAVALTSRAEPQQFDFRDEKGEMHSVKLPTTVLKLMVDVLSEIGQGNAVSIIPIHAELTTQEAVDLLNVSRPYFVQLLEKRRHSFSTGQYSPPSTLSGRYRLQNADRRRSSRGAGRAHRPLAGAWDGLLNDGVKLHCSLRRLRSVSGSFARPVDASRTNGLVPCSMEQHDPRRVDKKCT